jgi:DNA-3-methyladenine glycosylase II
VVGPTDAEIEAARRVLAQRDPLLAKADAAVPPTSWRVREAGFGGLVRQIIGQQVSVAASAAILGRFTQGLGGVLTPDGVLAADEAQLRGYGLSGQKARYVRAIAEAAGLFDQIAGLSDEEALAALTAIKGVGRWTAETYLLFSEGRLDFFPAGDVALQEGYRLAEGAPARPSEKALYARAEGWRPYRGVAALLLWGYYGVMRRRATEAADAPTPE